LFQKGAVLLALAIVVGCGSSMATDKPEPIQGHLVYEKLIGKRGVWIADVDGGNPQLLVRDGRSPVISPDGEWVAYVGGCDSDGEDVCKGTFVVSTSGGEPRKVASDVHLRPAPSCTWSPDSKRIVVTRGSTAADETLVSIDLASGKESKVATGGSWGWTFSPDGKQIAYAQAVEASDGVRVDLFVVDSAGGEPNQITDTGDSAAPVWGPTSIAFSRLVPAGDWGRSEIWEIQPDGSGRKTITGRLPDQLRRDGFDGLAPVAWSDDGRALLSGWTSGSGAIPAAVDPETGEIREIVENEFAHAVAISRDGRVALAYTYPPIGGFEEDTATVLIVPYDGGKPMVVARGAGSPSWNR
jgi:WD40 repeat protein